MAEPFVRAIREEDVAQIHEIETLCFAMPWSEESILHDIRENVAVHPDFRRQGYGRRIFLALCALAKENSMALMTLEVRRSNLAAQALYHQCGFLDVGYRKRYYEDNREDALIMYREFRPD